MKCEISIDREHEEGVWVYLHEHRPLADEIARLVAGEGQTLVGYGEREMYPLDPHEVECFSVEGGTVFALLGTRRLALRRRLYQVEELLGRDFVRLNQSCIANIRKIKKFEATLSGALCVSFQNGHREYVSRRQLKAVKERMGFRL